MIIHVAISFITALGCRLLVTAIQSNSCSIAIRHIVADIDKLHIVLVADRSLYNVHTMSITDAHKRSKQYAVDAIVVLLTTTGLIVASQVLYDYLASALTALIVNIVNMPVLHTRNRPTATLYTSFCGVAPVVSVLTYAKYTAAYAAAYVSACSTSLYADLSELIHGLEFMYIYGLVSSDNKDIIITAS
jgi:hypothetical protein